MNEREKQLARSRKNRQRIRWREEIYSVYGDICDCCGETNPLFLTLDHVNNDGASHRKNLTKDPLALYRWVRNNNYPDTIQLMCYNCNMGKARNKGICPHMV